MTSSEQVFADAALLSDRRRLSRRLYRWRALALLSFFGIAVWFLFGSSGFFFGDSSSSGSGFGLSGLGGEHVARVRIEGLMLEDSELLESLSALAEDDSVSAVIVRIDSPGGSASAAEGAYRALRRLAEAKPVAATIEGVAASGGYLAAIAADRIISRANGLTGSIGAYFRWARFDGLLSSVGIGLDQTTSGPLKGEPLPSRRISPEAREMFSDVVSATHEWFSSRVGERRNLEGAALAAVTDGRIFIGSQALDAGLVDAIGDEVDALEWLREERGISADLEVIDRYPLDPGIFSRLAESGASSAVRGMLGVMGSAFGLSSSGSGVASSPTPLYLYAP